MKIIYESGMGLSDTKFREIGRIIAHWSLLEMLIGLAIGNMLGLDRKEGRRRTLEESVYQLTEMLVEAGHECKLSKPETDRMNSLIARIKKEHPRVGRKNSIGVVKLPIGTHDAARRGPVLI